MTLEDTLMNVFHVSRQVIDLSVKRLLHCRGVTLMRDSEFPPSEAFIRTLCKKDQLREAFATLSDLENLGTLPPNSVYITLLRACNKQRALTEARIAYEHLVKHKLELNPQISEHLVITLARCGALAEACDLFQRLPIKSTFVWTAMISAYTECSQSGKAIQLYHCLQAEGIEPNECTYINLLKACGDLGDLEEGRKVHADLQIKGYTANVYVNSTLISMYGKCRNITLSEDVFLGMAERNIVSWNAMLSAYADQEQWEKVLQLYRQMHEEGVEQNEWSLMAAVQACGGLSEREGAVLGEGHTTHKTLFLEIGQALHSEASRKGLASHIFVGNSLVTMYGKCGALKEAELVFSSLSHRNTVSWNAMLSALLENGEAEKALQLYWLMNCQNVNSNKLTLPMAIQACGVLAEKEKGNLVDGRTKYTAAWHIGQGLHTEAQRTGVASEMLVGSALISMYGKCGSINDVEQVFAVLDQRDVVTWNAMFSACVDQGEGERALDLYVYMQKECVGINMTTLLSLLQACKHLGSTKNSLELYFMSICSGYDVDPVLATTLVHVLGSYSNMEDADAIFHLASYPTVATWTAQISGYARQGSFMTCIQLFEEMQFSGVAPNNITYLLLIYACNHSGNVHKATEYFIKRIVGETPNLKHYGCMIDLLGRAGEFDKAQSILQTMSMQADLCFWMGLLGSCRIHGNEDLGKHAFRSAVSLQPNGAAAYILMAGIFENSCLENCSPEG